MSLMLVIHFSSQHTGEGLKPDSRVYHDLYSYEISRDMITMFF